MYTAALWVKGGDKQSHDNTREPDPVKKILSHAKTALYDMPLSWGDKLSDSNMK